MSMDFIKILGDIIQEQRPQGGARRSVNVPSSGGAGVNAGASAAQSNSTPKAWSKVPEQSWKSGDKIDSPLKNPGKCTRWGEYRGTKRGYHNDCDIPVPVGTAIFAPHDGTFSEVDNSICGNGIIIKGKDENGNELHSGFCHLRNREVPSDGKVKKGDLIGFTGGGKKHGSNTEYEPGAGRSGGPHLHWKFKVNGKEVNPYTYN